MSVERTKCPLEFNPDTMASVLNEAGVNPASAANGKELFAYNWSIAGYCRDSMYENKAVLAGMLKLNGTAVFKKSIVVAGLKQWNLMHGMVLTKARSPSFLYDQAYNLVHMCRGVRLTKQNMSTGDRLPAWLVDLAKLVDVKCPVPADSDISDFEAAPLRENRIVMRGSSDTPTTLPIATQKTLFLNASSGKTRARPLLRKVTSDLPTPRTSPKRLWVKTPESETKYSSPALLAHKRLIFGSGENETKATGGEKKKPYRLPNVGATKQQSAAVT